MEATAPIEVHTSIDAPIHSPALPQLWLLVAPQGADPRAWRRAQLQLAISALTGVPAGLISLAANAMGQLAAAPRAELPRPPALSVSEADGAVAVALARDGAIGVDLEPETSLAHVEMAFDGLATASERTDLECAAGDRAAMLLGWWTAKEALLKALGMGVRPGPEAVALAVRDGAWQVASVMERPELAHGWRLHSGRATLAGAVHLWTVAASTPAPVGD